MKRSSKASMKDQVVVRFLSEPLGIEFANRKNSQGLIVSALQKGSSASRKGCIRRGMVLTAIRGKRQKKIDTTSATVIDLPNLIKIAGGFPVELTLRLPPTSEMHRVQSLRTKVSVAKLQRKFRFLLKRRKQAYIDYFEDDDTYNSDSSPESDVGESGPGNADDLSDCISVNFNNGPLGIEFKPGKDTGLLVYRIHKDSPAAGKKCIRRGMNLIAIKGKQAQLDCEDASVNSLQDILQEAGDFPLQLVLRPAPKMNENAIRTKFMIARLQRKFREKLKKKKDEAAAISLAKVNHHKVVANMIVSFNTSVVCPSPKEVTLVLMKSVHYSMFSDVEKILSTPNLIKDINTAIDGYTTLFVAVQTGDASIVSLILKQDKVLVSYTADDERLVGQNAQEGENCNIVDKSSLKLRADGELESEMKMQPLHIGCEMGRLDIVELLVSHPSCRVNTFGWSSNGDACTALLVAAQHGHREVVRCLLKDKSINVNMGSKQYSGVTPLLAASANGHHACVRELLKAPGIDILRSRAKDGATPLLIASKRGHSTCARQIRDKLVEMEEEAARELDRRTCKFCGAVDEWCPCNVPGWMERRAERTQSAVKAIQKLSPLPNGSARRFRREENHIYKLPPILSTTKKGTDI